MDLQTLITELQVILNSGSHEANTTITLYDSSSGERHTIMDIDLSIDGAIELNF